jgi:mannan endo-1,4-beta-mannosidase
MLLLLLAVVGLAHPIHLVPADPAATAPARQLYQRLARPCARATLFGHQDDLTAGVDWRDQPNRSDVRQASGAYPAVFGWDAGNVEIGKSYNFNGVPLAGIRAGMRRAAALGGLSTLSWHLNNPLTGGTAWDTTAGTVAALLPGGAGHQRYRQNLDSLARFISSLTDAQGQAIPLIFRPFHESTGSWFWWGQRHCAATEYVQLWRFTVDYLRQQKHLHNLLLAYSPANFRSAAHYLERYPGDAYVDVLGLDAYCGTDARQFQQQLRQQFAVVAAVARMHHKLSALTETGCSQDVPPRWWTQTLLPVLLRFRPAYVLAWRSRNRDFMFAPGPGWHGSPDFRAFKRDPGVAFGPETAPRDSSK